MKPLSFSQPMFVSSVRFSSEPAGEPRKDESFSLQQILVLRQRFNQEALNVTDRDSTTLASGEQFESFVKEQDEKPPA